MRCGCPPAPWQPQPRPLLVEVSPAAGAAAVAAVAAPARDLQGASSPPLAQWISATAYCLL
ncbi:rCG52482 [Rattus norvegicus]|uniref:RCG52482 n=1 Tax=Rattus norvegicus TaxID=10116 RepID=A6K0U1_RAT|nr:rCG52482 [Rattus norvegicus]